MRKFLRGFALLITILLAVVVIRTMHKPIYGNDENSILEVITSINLYEGKSIHILEIYDFDDSRVVTFLSNSWPSIIEFDKNSHGNYVTPRSETRQNEKLSHFIRGNIGHKKEVVVFSVKNELATTEEYSFNANEAMYTVDFKSGHPNSQWTKLLKSDIKGYAFEWFIHED